MNQTMTVFCRFEFHFDFGTLRRTTRCSVCATSTVCGIVELYLHIV